MSISYSVHLVSDATVDALLPRFFQLDIIAEPIAGTDMVYVRGNRFLAHGKPTDAKVNKQLEAFDFAATISINFFPDGVSSVNAALDTLLRCSIAWTQATSDDVLVLSNMAMRVLVCRDRVLTTDLSHPFWSPQRRELLSQLSERSS